MKKRSRVKRLARFVLRGGRRRVGAAGPLKNSPRYVLFDFDGTLGDTFLQGFEILNILAGEFGFRPLPHGDLQYARDLSTSGLMKHLGISRMKLHKISKRGTEEIGKRIDSVQSFEGVPEMVRQLHAAGFRLGEFKVRHHPRTRGQANYGLRQLWLRPTLAMLRLRRRLRASVT